MNYVLNGGLEKYSQCPTELDQIKYATYWSSIDTTDIDPSCSPEYCNACATAISGVGVPNGGFYHHYTRSGKGMAEVVMNSDVIGLPFYQRDYLQGRLYKYLTSGTSYCVTFYVTLEYTCWEAVNNIGAYLDNGNIDAGQDSAMCATPQTTYTPQLFETAVISDSINWIKVQGSFIANGNEKFITIGNFFDNAHTTIIPMPGTGGGGAFYLVDDVSVIESTQVANAGPDAAIGIGDSVHIGTSEEGMPCTWYVSGSSIPIGYSGGIWVKPIITTTYVVEMDLCGHVTRDSMKVYVWPLNSMQLSKYANVQMYPNPVKEQLIVAGAGNSEFYVYDLVGSTMLRKALAKEKEEIDLSLLPKGIYIVQVIDPSTGLRITKKIVKE